MALGECPECTKPVSTAASACPHCGCPLREGKKQRSYLGPLLLIFTSLVLFATFYDQKYPATNNQTRSTSPVRGTPRCDNINATQVVQQALNGGVLLRIDDTSDVSHVYILEPWRGLTIDDKTALDHVIQCTVTTGAPAGSTIVVYHDGHSGKELATSTQLGFRMD